MIDNSVIDIFFLILSQISANNNTNLYFARCDLYTALMYENNEYADEMLREKCLSLRMEALKDEIPSNYYINGKSLRFYDGLIIPVHIPSLELSGGFDFGHGH